MSQSSAEAAQQMLREQGYLSDGEYNFGEADSHFLRGFYLVATGKIAVDGIGYFQLRDILDNLYSADPERKIPPPWKLDKPLL